MKKTLSVLFLVLVVGALGCVCFLRYQAKGTDAVQAEESAVPAPAATPAPTAAVTVSAAPAATPEPTPEPTEKPDYPDIDISSWEYILANPWNNIGDYTPTLATLEGQQFDERIVDAMSSFVAAARAEGLSVLLSSGYRDYATQTYLYNKKVSEVGAATAGTIVAVPGTSEHQTGLCCDITDQYYATKTSALENTALYQWMEKHCAEYGFIVRFPKGKEDITGIIYEPWHFRYVGVEAAAYIMEHGLCLEEFLALYEEEPEDSEEPDPASADGTVQLTLTFAGDTTLGYDANYGTAETVETYYEKYGADYFLQNFRDLFSSDDLTLVNLEGPLTTATSHRTDRQYIFKGDPAYVSILTGASVEAVNLANNHSMDYLTQGYEDTANLMEENGIAWCGNDHVDFVEVKGIKIALIGFQQAKATTNSALENAMQEAKDGGADLIVCSFHWGEELYTAPTSGQVALGRKAVDLGADIVIGTHPHVIQGIEEYKGKNIIYSLGNFCFGGSRSPTEADAIVFQQTFTFVDGKLQEDNDSTVIPVWTNSTGTRQNDYCPVIAEGDTASAILEKLEKRTALIPQG